MLPMADDPQVRVRVATPGRSREEIGAYLLRPVCEEGSKLADIKEGPIQRTGIGVHSTPFSLAPIHLT
jgi:hypothetical protein